MYCREVVKIRFDKKLMWIAFLYLLATTIFQAVGWLPKCITGGLAPVLRITQSVAIWIVADILTHLPKPFWWAKLSFAIYVTHSMILESIEKMFLLLLGQSFTGALLDFIFAPMITLMLILLIAKVAFHFFPRICSVLLGGRGF